MNKQVRAGKYQYSDDVHSSHHKILDLVGEGKKVMDVGCSRGYLAAKFKEKGCFVLGIESDPQSALIAKEFCDELVTGDVEQLDKLKYPENYFDVIVFADVLEHLKHPENVLINLKKYLKKDGRIIASLPNIARIDIRMKLLLGKFDYEEGGILDKTHLRFFTLKNAKKLFINCGLNIESIAFTASASRFKIFPELLAFQFVIVSKIKEK